MLVTRLVFFACMLESFEFVDRKVLSAIKGIALSYFFFQLNVVYSE